MAQVTKLGILRLIWMQKLFSSRKCPLHAKGLMNRIPTYWLLPTEKKPVMVAIATHRYSLTFENWAFCSVVLTRTLQLCFASFTSVCPINGEKRFCFWDYCSLLTLMTVGLLEFEMTILVFFLHFKPLHFCWTFQGLIKPPTEWRKIERCYFRTKK